MSTSLNARVGQIMMLIIRLNRRSKTRSLPKSARDSSGKKTTCTMTSTRKTR